MSEKIRIVIGEMKPITKDATKFIWKITPTSFDSIPDNALISDSDAKCYTKSELESIINSADAWEFFK
jgi:hypothetical protein